MSLSPSEIEALLAAEPITDEWPWSTRDRRVVDKNVKDIVAEIRRKVRVKDETEYEDYGSGHASFVDCWLYRPDEDFRMGPGNNYAGLVVLFSRLSHFFVLGEGSKAWGEQGGIRYMPSLEFVDDIKHPAVVELVPRVAAILEARRLRRLSKSDLSSILRTATPVPTVLGDAVLHHFDALFYWED